MSVFERVRPLVKDIMPYVALVFVLSFAKAGVPETLCSLIAGGILMAIDPRRGQQPSPPSQETKP